MEDEQEIVSLSEGSTSSDEEDGDGENKLLGGDSMLDSSDSSDSDEDVEMDVDEDALNEELRQINDTLAENPYSYDSYAPKIRILKKLGDLEKLRETRNKFSELYPLSGSIWLDWLKDEVKLACTEEEKDELTKLFDRAVADYLCVDIWLEYINFRISNVAVENGLEKCRDVFERALGSCGLHVSMGSLIWDMYRDFEAALLGTATTEELLKVQENRFINLCRRQLSVPLLGMDHTYKDIKPKIEIDENFENAYRKALERLDFLETWEGKLIQQTEENKIQIYRDYIENEKKTKCNPARIQCLYERSVTEYPLDSSLWIAYLEYLSKYLKIGTIILEVAHRASRNCPWDVNVWLKYMAVVEEFSEASATLEVIKTVFEKAIVYCSTGETAGTVWIKYLEFLRRKIDFSNSSESQEMKILRKTFVAAEQHLLQLLPEPNEYISEILFFRVRFEAQCAKGINDNVKNLWKELTKRDYSKYSKIWVQYILLQISYGADIRALRALYNKAISAVKDDLQLISNLWINFERDRGDFNTLRQCETKIAIEMAKNVTSFPSAPLSSSEFSNLGAVNINGDAGSPKAKKRKAFNDEDVVLKRKRRNEDTVDSDKTGEVFKVPAIPDKNTVKAVVKSTLKHGDVVKHDSRNDARTVFLSNLSYTSEETEIRNFFVDIGEIEEIRLARDFKGRSKGFGYVCFFKEEQARKALVKDRQPLSGRPAFVSKCDPDKATRQKQFKYSMSLEKNKLFVKGLPFSFTADELRNLFQVHGDLKDCRLVTYRNGHSKGIAYVEFIDETSASQAIMKIDGTTIGDMQVSVSISNPPTRDASKSTQGFQQATSTTAMSQRRTPKVFVPRSLQVNTKQPTTSTSSSSNLPKSNQDFRKMFLK